MGRAPCCEKVGLKKGRWTAEEDELLLKYIQANGEGSWRSLPKNAGLLRCGKSCRLRWINYLRADLKRGNICKEEEDVIIKLHASYGNRWSLIAGSLPGRTDNEIKNYWNSHLSRRIDSFRRINDGAPIVVVDIDKIPGGCKRKGTRTSKSALKKKKNHQEDLRKEKQKSIAKTPSTISKKNEDQAKIPVTFHQQSEVILDTISIAEIPSIISNRNEDQQKTPATFQQESEVILDTSAVKENEEGLESGISSPSKGSENETDENGCLCIEERRTESGVSDSKEESESGGNGANEERCESEDKEIEWHSLMDTCFEEIGSLQEDFFNLDLDLDLDKDFDLDWNGMGEKLMMEGGEEIWSWLWESDNEEGNFQPMECEQEKYAAWLLSADTNDL